MKALNAADPEQVKIDALVKWRRRRLTGSRRVTMCGSTSRLDTWGFAERVLRESAQTRHHTPTAADPHETPGTCLRFSGRDVWDGNSVDWDTALEPLLAAMSLGHTL